MIETSPQTCAMMQVIRNIVTMLHVLCAFSERVSYFELYVETQTDRGLLYILEGSRRMIRISEDVNCSQIQQNEIHS